MKRIALFDFGDTLVGYYRLPEFPPILAACIDQASAYLAELGLPTIAADLLRQRTQAENFEAPDARVRPLETRLSNIFGLGTDTLTTAQQMALCRAFMQPIFATATVYSDTLPTLRRLRDRDFRVGVISNTPWGSPSEPWREEVARHGIAAYCDHLTFCRDVGWRKPARQVFEHVLRLFDCDPEECYFVGDHPKWDIAGPRAVGIDAILIDRHDQFFEVDAPRITSLEDLERVLTE